MYNNIGGKIKGLAVFFCILGILGSLTVGTLAIVAGSELDFFVEDGVIYGAVGGVLIIIVGSLISWVSSFLLYGFGQLVQNSDRISTALNKQNRFIDNNAPQRFGTYQNPTTSVPNQPYGAGGGNAYGNSDASAQSAQYGANTYYGAQSGADANYTAPESEIGNTTVL